jgi:DMSO reductase family type II enzyme heme b subunit
MKKSTVILISLTAIILFAGLVYYGLSHSRGVPIKLEKPEKVILEVQFLDKEIDVAKNSGPDIWQALPKKEIELMRQVTVLPWGKSLVSPVIVSAFHNKKDIYFYISWKDDTQDRDAGINTFSDGCAVMFPMGKDIPPSTIMMGFMNKANIWHWKASRDREYWLAQEKGAGANELPQRKVYADYHYPFEEEELFVVSKDIPKSAVNDLIAIRVGTITPKDIQNVQGRGFWANGSWQVVFKRPIAIKDAEIDAQLEPAVPAVAPPLSGQSGADNNKLCAFSVWNGASGDRGGRKSISDWVELDIK